MRASWQERLWNRIRMAPGDGCWEWQGSKNYLGYGSAWDGEKVQRAHRLAYSSAYGKIPEGKMVLHKCDNRACCRPQHLFIGNQDANMKDMAAKGRGRDSKGEKNPRAKINEETAREIFKARSTGKSLSAVARQFRVSLQLVWNIEKGVSWAHLRLVNG